MGCPATARWPGPLNPAGKTSQVTLTAVADTPALVQIATAENDSGMQHLCSLCISFSNAHSSFICKVCCQQRCHDYNSHHIALAVKGSSNQMMRALP